MDYRRRTSRRRNYDEPGHAHELTFSCYRGFHFLKAERTCRWFADALEAARREYDFALWAYVFMPDHAHVIVCPRRPVYRIEAIRKAIKQPVARKAMAYLRRNAPHWLPRIEERRTRHAEYHFWQPGGGFDRNITEPSTLAKMIDYIHLNPVRKRLVERTVDWPWSSAGWFEDSPKNTLRPDPIPPEWTAGTSGE